VNRQLLLGKARHKGPLKPLLVDLSITLPSLSLSKQGEALNPPSYSRLTHDNGIPSFFLRRRSCLSSIPLVIPRPALPSLCTTLHYSGVLRGPPASDHGPPVIYLHRGRSNTRTHTRTLLHTITHRLRHQQLFKCPSCAATSSSSTAPALPTPWSTR